MSNSKPTTRAELKEYIKLKLGAPVIQINLDDSQFDLAIDDAFQYFYEREHFDATERVYLSVQIEDAFMSWIKTGEVETVVQSDDQQRYADGMVDTLQLTTPGTNYAYDADLVLSTTGGSGEGLQIVAGSARTTSGGLVTVSVYNAGYGYQVGDVITVKGGGSDATFTVDALKTQSALYGTEQISTQNNYIVLPEGVIGVTQILSRGRSGLGGGIPGVGFFNPFLAGGAGGTGTMGGMSYSLTSYYTMQEYLATMQWVLYPPKSHNYNKRTRRLFLNTDNYAGQLTSGDYLVMECAIEANPDYYPDVFNDLFVKELAVAYTQMVWGRVLLKYNQVQLPGGITLNGQQIFDEGQQAAEKLKERFALDYANPVLDVVG